jgi:hypothetical protein
MTVRPDGERSEAQTAAYRRLPAWIRCELWAIAVGCVVMNVWSPDAEPWFWRLLFLALAAVCWAGLLIDFHEAHRG